MDKIRKWLKPPRKGISKKEQKTGKWRDKRERGAPAPRGAAYCEQCVFGNLCFQSYSFI